MFQTSVCIFHRCFGWLETVSDRCFIKSDKQVMYIHSGNYIYIYRCIYIYIFKLYTHLSGSRACPNDHVQRQPSERSITLKSQKTHSRWHVPSRLQSEGGTRGFSPQFWSGMLSVLSSRWVEYAAARPSVLQEAPEWLRVLMPATRGWWPWHEL